MTSCNTVVSSIPTSTTTKQLCGFCLIRCSFSSLNEMNTSMNRSVGKPFPSHTRWVESQLPICAPQPPSTEQSSMEPFRLTMPVRRVVIILILIGGLCDASRAAQSSDECKQQGFQSQNCTHLFFVAQTAPCVHAITCRRLSGLPQWSSDPQPSHVVLFRNLKEITGVCVIKLQQYVHIYSMTKIGSKPQSPR